MLRVTVELVPYGIEQGRSRLGVLEIFNDGTGTPSVGNYGFRVISGERCWKRGRVLGFLRQKFSSWSLLRLVLREAFAARRGSRGEEGIDPEAVIR